MGEALFGWVQGPHLALASRLGGNGCRSSCFYSDAALTSCIAG